MHFRSFFFGKTANFRSAYTQLCSINSCIFTSSGQISSEMLQQLFSDSTWKLFTFRKILFTINSYIWLISLQFWLSINFVVLLFVVDACFFFIFLIQTFRSYRRTEIGIGTLNYREAPENCSSHPVSVNISWNQTLCLQRDSFEWDPYENQ